jgi:hypothetical protein
MTRLSTPITEASRVGLRFTVDHDSAPAPGSVPTDTILAATLEALF